MPNYLKKLFISIMLGVVFCVPTIVLAADSFGLEGAKGSLPTAIGAGNARTIPAVIGEVVGIGLSLIGVLFFVLMLYGGLYWMIARGDTGKIDKAKEIMEAAVLGLIIVTGSYAIANFVFSGLASK